jgi:ParB family chromosome partitioning protein
MAEEVQHAAELRDIPISAISADPNQPRRDFSRGSELEANRIPLEALADSIKDQGVLQPIIVRPAGKNKYTIVAGERRWRATKMAGLSTIPALVRVDLDGMKLEMAQLAENLQRQDLSDNDIAIALEGLMARYPELLKKDLAKMLNRAPSYISRMLGMRAGEAKDLVEAGIITYASVNEALKAKSKAVQDLAISEAKSSGKPITHDSISRAEAKLIRHGQGVKVDPDFAHSLMAEMGFARKPGPLNIDPASGADFEPPEGSRPAGSGMRVGKASEARFENSPEMVHRTKMGWMQFVKLCEVQRPETQPLSVDVSLSSREIREVLQKLGKEIPRDEFERISSLHDALRELETDAAAPKPARKRAMP